MIKLGYLQSLRIKKIVEFGIYLCDDDDEDSVVLLPKKQVPADSRPGDRLDVFVYKDSEDRIISTVKAPLMEIGKVAALEVKQVTKIGAFLDWGLEKDLFLPYKEQTYKVRAGDVIPVTLYVDKSDRLCASMKVYRCLSSDSQYQAGEWVDGFVYEISPRFGAFVAVDYKYSALLPLKECLSDVRAGDSIRARVTAVQPDGRLSLSLREKAYMQMDMDAKLIYDRLVDAGGFMPLHDKSSPDEIREELAMSKNEFKRAIGRLFKQKKIIILEDGIRLVQ